ncbi:MAG: FAD-dependent oxidoreductase [Candidatus Obscuribacterales bacterium]|nr:FAD-dependent oxidoreductase [Candidatus Obscuribacterales bacterium]
MSKTRIIILGAGFAGVKCARVLRNLLALDSYEIVLFNRENHMVFHPLLAEVAGAALQPENVAAPLRQLLKNVWCRTEEVLSIDIDNSEIEYEAHDSSRRRLSYDQLVISCGNEVSLGIVPGMDDHAYPLKTIGDALALQSHIMEQMEKAEVCDDPAQKRFYLSFVVVGGGFSGVEVAGEINDLVRRSLKFFRNISHEDISVTIVHSREQLLPEVSPSLREFTGRCMKKSGVRVLLNAVAARATAQGITLKDGSQIYANTVVCTIGTSASALVKRLNLPKQNGRLQTEADMSIAGYPNVWAIGDCAAVINHADNKLCPPVAQFAERQGVQLAKNIKARLSGKPTCAFSYRMMGQLCAIGGHKAVAELMGVRLSGFLAWFIWRGVYLMKLPSFFQQLKVGLEWACDLIFPRTLAHLKANRSRKISRAFYGAGDIVLREGDAGTEFYSIEEGEVEVLKRIDDRFEVLAVLGPGDFFGEAAVLENRPRNATIRARTDIELTVMGANVFSQISGSLSPLRDAIVKAAKRRTNIWKNLHEIRAVLDEIPLKFLIEPIGQASLYPEVHVADAISLINEKRLDFCFVVDQKQTLVGIVSRSDLLRSIEVAAALPEGAEMKVQVQDIMVKEPISIHIDESSALAVMTMREHGFKTLPVISDSVSKRLEGYLRIERIMDTIIKRMLVYDKNDRGRVAPRVTKEIKKLHA